MFLPSAILINVITFKDVEDYCDASFGINNLQNQLLYERTSINDRINYEIVLPFHTDLTSPDRITQNFPLTPLEFLYFLVQKLLAVQFSPREYKNQTIYGIKFCFT